MIERGCVKFRHLLLLLCLEAAFTMCSLQQSKTGGTTVLDGGKEQLPQLSQSHQPLQVPQALQSHQRFRVRPANLSVVEGETAVLPCQVDHQTGALQWTKQGFALGYSHDLPGYPRYRMIGDASIGEHHLEIRNVSLSDDGSFQCQVLPGRGQNAIKAVAFLTVLVRPESVSITSPSRELPDRRYEMMVNRKLILMCNVTMARPAAVIVWKKNGLNITKKDKIPLDYSEKITVLPSMSNQQKPQQQTDSSVLYTTISRLVIPLSVQDNNAEFTCSVQHPAIKDTEQKQFRDSVHVSVLYPPGAPEIVGINQQAAVISGDIANLTCRSRGGNPPADIAWLENQQTLPRHYRVTDQGAEASVHVKATVSTGRSLFRCQVSSVVRPEPQEASIRLRVYYGPLNISIAGSRQIRGGEEVILGCSASNSNPAANISWTIDDRHVKVGSSNLSQETQDQTEQQFAGDELSGYSTLSNISVQVPEAIDRDIKVTCSAVNVHVGVTRRSSVIITVLRPPKQPYITGLAKKHWLSDGDIVSLTCTAKGGNPPANLTWWTDSSYITAGALKHHNDGVSRKLTLTVSSEDNDREILCKSASPAMSKSQSVAVTLRVAFPPKSLQTAIMPPNRPTPSGNTRVKLICQSTAANPPVNISWVDESDQVIEGHAEVTHTKSGHHGGFSTRLELSTNLTWRDNGRRVLCVAKIAERPILTSSPVKLNVAHAPVFKENQYRLDATLGETNQTRLTLYSNPATDMKIFITRPADSSSGIRLKLVKNNVVRLVNASRGDMGWYQVEASNSLGVGAANLFVNVLYPPSIVTASESITVRAGQDIRVACRIDANPISASSVRWLQNGLKPNNTEARAEFTNGTSVLTLFNVSSNDTGYYSCMVNNTIGATSAKIPVVVEDQIRICAEQSRKQFMSIDSPLSAEITCFACGSSNITFRWLKRNSELPIHTTNGSDAKYVMTKIRMGLTKWKSTLLINAVDRSDVSVHKCVVANRYGSDQIEIALSNISVPQVPTLLRVAKTSHNTATLSWQRGFNGGLPQKFKLRYQFADRPYRYVGSISGNSSSYEIGHLLQDSKYHFWICAYNRIGQSGYTRLPVIVHTAGAPPVGYITDREDDGPADEPSAAAGGAGSGPAGPMTGSLTLSQLLVIGSMGAGSILLLVNTSIALCYLRRRRSMRRAADSALLKPGSKPHRSTNQTHCEHTDESNRDEDCGNFNSQSRFERGISTVSMATSDTFLRDDSADFFQGSETLQNTVQIPTDCGNSNFQHTALLHDKQLITDSSGIDQLPDGIYNSLNNPTTFQQLEPPRLPHFLQRQTIHSKAPDLIENGISTSNHLPSRNSCHLRLPLSSTDSLTYSELAMGQVPSALGHPDSTALQRFSSLPRAPRTGLMTFSRVTSPPPCIELEPVNHHV